MATLLSVSQNIADMLRRPGDSDILSKVKAEVANTVRHYNRRVNWLLERRGMSITTTSGTTFYSSVDNSSSTGFGDAATGTAPTATDDLKDLIRIVHARLEQGAIDWPLDILDYRSFQDLLETNTVTGQPRFITFFAGQIGFWPTPNAAYACEISGMFKPRVPVNDSDESAWFDNHLELIETSTARRVAQKWLQDMEMMQFFAASEKEQEGQMMAEGVNRMTTGKTRVSAADAL